MEYVAIYVCDDSERAALGKHALCSRESKILFYLCMGIAGRPHRCTMHLTLPAAFESLKCLRRGHSANRYRPLSPLREQHPCRGFNRWIFCHFWNLEFGGSFF